MKLLALFAILAAALAAQVNSWFPPGQLMTIGVYYYPEAWPESQWERDIANIKKLGFEYIHMSEFAWAFMEPEEGRYDFTWLDKSVALAQKYGLKVILCTPTATPPAWLSRNHPEILMVRGDGTRMNHGSREQADWSSPVYRKYAENIISKMAERYGLNPTVWGWQLDNELSHYGAGMSYAPAAQSSFRAWLREKYGTVSKLNEDWGNAFWSQMYNELRPGADAESSTNWWRERTRTRCSTCIDGLRGEASDYSAISSSVLRQHVKNQWITTNFMMNYDLVESRALGKGSRHHELHDVSGERRSVSRRTGISDGRPGAGFVYERLPAEPGKRCRRPDGIAARAGQLGACESAGRSRASFMPGLCGPSRWEDGWYASTGIGSRWQAMSCITRRWWSPTA